MTAHENEIRALEEQIAENERAHQEYRVFQRLRWIWLGASIVLALVFLGFVSTALWRVADATVLAISLVAALTSTILASWLLIRSRRMQVTTLVELDRLYARRKRVASADIEESEYRRRRYRHDALEQIGHWRERSNRYRMPSNAFQGTIIVGSASVTLLASASLAYPDLRWMSAIVSLLVSISAGFSAFFKYRERSFNLQQSADTGDKEYNALDLRIGDYAQDRIGDEGRALTLFAERFEALKEEQRKRELQLDQAPETEQRGRSGGQEN